MSLSIISITRLRIIIFLCLLMMSTNAQSQIIDWIIDQAAQSIVNEAESQLSGMGNTLWNSIIESNAKSSVENKAKTFKDIPIDRSKEAELAMRYKNMTLCEYPGMYAVMLNNINAYLNPLKNIKMSVLGDGTVMRASQLMQDSINNSIVVKQLSEIMIQQVLDSLSVMEDSKQLSELLLDDINYSKAIAVFLNNHPEAVRVYANSSKTELRGNLSHLYYWSVGADAHKEYLSKKKNKLINPRFVKFVQSNDEVIIYYGNRYCGKIKGNEISCNTIDLLNLCGAPNMEYYYGNMVYRTDAIGRVVQSLQVIENQYKSKCKEKGSIKSKYFAKFKSNESFNHTYGLGLKKYQSPDCNMNTIYMRKDEHFKKHKKMIKLIQKKIGKSQSKYVLETKLNYNDECTYYVKNVDVELLTY